MEVIKEQFPSFHLEDKVTLLGGSIVRPLIKNVYKRRGENNCYVLSIVVNFNRTTVTIIRSSLLGIVSS